MNFKGSIEEFWERHIEPNLPSHEQVEAFHRMLLVFLNNEAHKHYPLLVRRFEGFQPRGVLYKGDDNTWFVCGDNEPALWCYARALEGHIGTRYARFEALLTRQGIPIGFATDSKKGEDKSYWKNWGREAWEAKLFASERFYHAHLFDAANDLGHLPLNREGLKVRSVRFLHPANHFLTFTHQKDRGTRPYFLYNGRAQDFSEIPGVKHFVAEKFSKRYSSIWDEFLKMSQANVEDFKAVPDLQITCETASREEPSHASKNLEAQVAPSAVSVHEETGVDHFDIEENDKGKFHFKDFGQSTGGSDRDLPFIIRVFDKSSKALVARSEPVTAKDLGIGESGRRDYDLDNYRQYDFFVKVQSQVIPNSAIALRVPWAYLRDQSLKKAG